ncbi:MAG: hypothetical protein KDA24_15520 [Deltaproteobacteria bacterium]|nr:hypothetical protein [Deltaproteobacteria bacterium]
MRGRGLLAGWSLGLAAAVLGVAAWWLGRNDLPDGYQNEFIHLYTLVEIFFRWSGDGLGEAWPFLWDEYYPPLLHGPALLAMAVAGTGKTVAVLALGASVVPLLLATGELGRRASGAWAGAWAVTALAFAPAIFGNVRRYEPNVALAASVAVALWWLARGGLRGRRDVVVFGVICAAGLLVDRVIFAVYLAAPAVALMWRHRRWRSWAGAVAVVAVGAGYYYTRFVTLHADEILSQFGGEITADGESSEGFPVFSVRGLLYYGLAWVDGGLGLLPTLLVIVGVVLWGAGARRRATADTRLVLESTLVAGFAIFTVLGKKQPYYAIPLMAPAIVCAAAGWTTWVASDRARAVGLALLTLLGANQLAFMSRGEGLAPMPGRWATLGGASPLPAGYLGHEYVMAGPPFEQGLQIERMVELCKDAASGGRGLILLFSEGHGAYEGQMMPTLRLAAGHRRVPGMLMEPQAWEESADSATCFVYVARDPLRSWPTEQSIAGTFGQWNYHPPTVGLLDSLAATQRRATLSDRWISEPGEAVHVYALGSAPK